MYKSGVTPRVLTKRLVVKQMPLWFSIWAVADHVQRQHGQIPSRRQPSRWKVTRVFFISKEREG